MTAIEANAIALGVTPARLMESSGQAVARAVQRFAETGTTVEIVAGRGETGGIGFVTARFLHESDVTVSLIGDPETITSSTARENWDVLVDAECDRRAIRTPGSLDFDDPDLILDGICGTEFTGDLDDRDRAVIEAINESDATTVSVDVPSGLDADTGETPDVSVSAEHVVTFHRTKPGLESHPDVTVAEIGIPRAAERFVGPGEVRQFRDRLRAGKRDEDTGRVFVIGGGPFTGAPALSAQAALRAGADLSFVAVPDAVSDPIQAYTEDLIVQSYDGAVLRPRHVESLVETAEKYDDVVVVGPGLGDESETRDAAREFLEWFDGSVVVDADAIPVVPDAETDGTLVLTPNEDELVELGGPEVDGLREAADDIESFAAELGHTLVVKGRDSVITDGDETRIARGGTTGMTVGGTGDILSGVVAAFLGVAPPLEAACGAAYVKEHAGRHRAETHGAGFVASDLLEDVPQVIWPAEEGETE